MSIDYACQYYKLWCTFEKNFTSLTLVHVYSVKMALFSVSGLNDEKLIKSKPTWKPKHADTILESSEYFCQISSKSIPIILSYTVTKLVHFLRHSVYKFTTSSLHTVMMYLYFLLLRSVKQLLNPSSVLRVSLTEVAHGSLLDELLSRAEMWGNVLNELRLLRRTQHLQRHSEQLASPLTPTVEIRVQL